MRVTMTSKGQVTLPKPIRDTLLLEPGDMIEIMPEEGGSPRVAPLTAPVTRLKGMVPKPASPLSLAKMAEATGVTAGRVHSR